MSVRRTRLDCYNISGSKIRAKILLFALFLVLLPADPALVASVEVNVTYVIDPDCLGALNIFAEARSEPFEGQVAVGSVVRNRMERRYFSDGTVAGTIFFPWQFSWANTNDTQRRRVFACDANDPRYLRALEAWHASKNERPVGAAVLYHAHYVSPPWAAAPAVKLVRQIERHLFYIDGEG